MSTVPADADPEVEHKEAIAKIRGWFSGEVAVAAEEHEELSAALVGLDEIDGDVKRFLKEDDYFFYRFLKAMSFDPAMACVSLLAMVRWRREFRPWELPVERLQKEVAAGKAYYHGTDKKGRPLLIIKASQHSASQRDFEDCRMFACFCMELVCHLLKRANSRSYVVLYDAGNFGRDNVDLSIVKDLVGGMMKNYPEMMGKVYVVNYGWMWSTIYKMASLVLDPRTVAKVSMVSNFKELQSDFDLAQLPREYGGKSSYEYNPEAYLDENIPIIRNNFYEIAK